MLGRIVLAAAAVSLVIGAGTTNAASGDEARFDKLVAKYAPNVLDLFTRFKPKAASVCLQHASSIYANKPGIVVESGGEVGCTPPSFNSSGSLVGTNGFCSEWEILAK